MTSSTQRFLHRNEVSVQQGWALSEWCRSIGGDEFTLSCLSGDCPAEFCREVFTSLEPFFKAEAMRDTVYLRKERVQLWALNSASLAVLHRLMPDGIFTYRSDDEAWIEDFTVYRSDQMLLGVVTHEETACLCLAESEWQRFVQLEIRTHGPSV